MVKCLTSEAGMMTPSGTKEEEKSPLLQTEIPEEKYNISEDESLIEHNRAVYKGVALVVKSWPDHVSSGWTPVIYLSFFIFILSLIFLSSVMVLGRMNFSVDLRFQVGRYNLQTNETFLDFAISCEGQTISTAKFPEAVDQLSISRFLQLSHRLADPKPINTDDDIAEPLGRMFFVAREEDVTTERLCSVESAANLLPNTPVYFVILHNDELEPSGLTFVLENLHAVYKNLSVHRIGTNRYFSGSPLLEIFENSNASKFLSADMIEFAARVLTLWRYGGVSTHSSVIIKNGSSFPGRDNVASDVVVLSETGSVISAGHQCHELLFQIMSSLVKLANNSEHLYITSKEVISLARTNFCHNKTTTWSDDVNNISIDCPGVSLMKPELMCKSIDTKDTCLWNSVKRMLPEEKAKLCPLTFEQSTFIN